LGNIQPRQLNETVSYRVRIRRTGLPDFNLTFDSYEEAEDWLLAHEDSYLANPDKYHKWVRRKRIVAKKRRGIIDDIR